MQVALLCRLGNAFCSSQFLSLSLPLSLSVSCLSRVSVFFDGSLVCAGFLPAGWPARHIPIDYPFDADLLR